MSATRSRSNSFDDFSGSALSNDFKNIKNKDFKKSVYLWKNNLNKSLQKFNLTELDKTFLKLNKAFN